MKITLKNPQEQVGTWENSKSQLIWSVFRAFVWHSRSTTQLERSHTHPAHGCRLSTGHRSPTCRGPGQATQEQTRAVPCPGPHSWSAGEPTAPPHLAPQGTSLLRAASWQGAIQDLDSTVFHFKCLSWSSVFLFDLQLFVPPRCCVTGQEHVFLSVYLPFSSGY